MQLVLIVLGLVASCYSYPHSEEELHALVEDFHGYAQKLLESINTNARSESPCKTWQECVPDFARSEYPCKKADCNDGVEAEFEELAQALIEAAHENARFEVPCKTWQECVRSSHLERTDRNCNKAVCDASLVHLRTTMNKKFNALERSDVCKKAVCD